MKKNVKLVLCFIVFLAAILSSDDGFAGEVDVQSGDIYTISDTDLVDTIDNHGRVINAQSLDNLISEINNYVGGMEEDDGTIENTGRLRVDNLTNYGNIKGPDGTLSINYGENNGDISQANVIINGSFKNNNTLKVTNNLILKVSFENNSQLESSNLTNMSVFTNNKNVEANNINNASHILNTGSIKASNLENYSTISGNTGKLTIEGGNNEGDIVQDQIITVGDFTNVSYATLSANSFINNGTLVNEADAELLSSELVNNLTINNFGKVNISEKFTNNGEFVNSNSVIASTIENNVGKTFTNDSSVTADSVVNNGTFNNNSGATLISKTINNNDTMTNSGIIGSSTNKAAITNNGEFVNSHSVIASTIVNNVGKTFTNNSSVTAGSVVNNGTFENSGELVASYIENKTAGTFNNSYDLTTTNIKNDGIFNNANKIVVSNLENNKNILGAGQLEVTNGSNFGNIEQTEIVVKEGLYQGENASLVVDALTNNPNSVIENNGTITINNTLSNIGSIVNKGIFNSGATLDNTGTFINSGAKAILEATNITSNNIFGVDNGASVTLESIDNSNGKIYLTNNGALAITNQTGPLNGDLIVQNGKNNNFSLSNADFVGNLNIGNANTTLNFNTGSITQDAIVNIASQGRLNIKNNSNLILNTGDNVLGDLVLNDNGVVTLDGFKLTTGDTSTQEGGKLAYYEQSGGDLNIINNSTLSMGDSFLIYGGNILVDDNSAYLSRDGGFEVNTFKTSGLLGAMNSGVEDYLMNDMIIGNSLTGKNQADLTIDVYGRSNAFEEHATDMFIANNIKEDAGLSNAVINISDWGLAGDIFGWDAPIDRDITLENIFSGNISENVSLTATRKETFTPIGWYQLNNHGGTTGNYTLNLTRFNPQVYRGQVTTLAQWMNQLAIDDMLFNHSMLLPSFKDEDGGVAYSSVMANKYASVDPVFAPYQYSRKDGGLWYKMYGTFETMQMSQGLNNIGNNAYGALIGADFGLRELKNGWKYMPTAYIGYNGAHQYYSGVGAYQNGGQIGFLNTLYKNNFILGGLIYGGAYDNAIDVAGRNDSTFNYFGGAAIKTAYNIRLHRDWVLQPNLFAAYNYFGQQNWHSTYGQMGMMSGMLNGVNIAPGLNLIWEKETFSIYATLQYMYNANGAIGGRAGNVNLPHLCMDRGYIQYGLGFTKRISDRFSGYLQAVLRNVGRTGVGFQMGFNIQLGK